MEDLFKEYVLGRFASDIIDGDSGCANGVGFDNISIGHLYKNVGFLYIHD